MTTHNIHKRQTSMPSPEFKPAIPASELPQTLALVRPATGISILLINSTKSTLVLELFKHDFTKSSYKSKTIQHINTSRIISHFVLTLFNIINYKLKHKETTPDQPFPYLFILSLWNTQKDSKKDPENNITNKTDTVYLHTGNLPQVLFTHVSDFPD
jgi:hypothetical protein